jgi:competence protein ComGC
MFHNNRGFTLVEMLIVLMIISVLIILIVPNLGGKSADVNEKGCNALISVVQAQADAYYLETNSHVSSIDDLKSEGYITTEQTKCPNGKDLIIDENNKVDSDS